MGCIWGSSKGNIPERGVEELKSRFFERGLLFYKNVLVGLRNL